MKISNPKLTGKQRDTKILNLLAKWKVCSRNQIATILFSQNANPVYSTTKTMKRLSMNGLVKPIIRKKDESYLYTANPSAIHPNSNKINHQLKLLDYYIEANQPSQCVIEPILGKYEPDLLYRDEMNRSICVEIQLTKISKKRMQEKINNFIEEYGVNHDAKILYICTSILYKDLKTKQGFKVIQRNLPKEVLF